MALWSAIPLEAINFWVVGYPAGEHPLSRVSRFAAMALEWDIVHLPGIIANDRFRLLRENPVACSTGLLLLGYIDTVILLFVALSIGGLARRALRRLSSPMKRAA